MSNKKDSSGVRRFPLTNSMPNCGLDHLWASESVQELLKVAPALGKSTGYFALARDIANSDHIMATLLTNYDLASLQEEVCKSYLLDRRSREEVEKFKFSIFSLSDGTEIPRAVLNAAEPIAPVPLLAGQVKLTQGFSTFDPYEKTALQDWYKQLPPPQQKNLIETMDKRGASQLVIELRKWPTS